MDIFYKVRKLLYTFNILAELEEEFDDTVHSKDDVSKLWSKYTSRVNRNKWLKNDDKDSLIESIYKLIYKDLIHKYYYRIEL